MDWIGKDWKMKKAIVKSIMYYGFTCPYCNKYNEVRRDPSGLSPAQFYKKYKKGLCCDCRTFDDLQEGLGIKPIEE